MFESDSCDSQILRFSDVSCHDGMYKTHKLFSQIESLLNLD